MKSWNTCWLEHKSPHGQAPWTHSMLSIRFRHPSPQPNWLFEGGLQLQTIIWWEICKMHNVRKDELIYKASACNSLLHITNTIDKKAKANGKSNASLLIISRANIQVLNKKRKSKKKREKKVNDVVRTAKKLN